MGFRNQIRWFAPGGEREPISKREFQSLEIEGQAALLQQIRKLQRSEIGLTDLRHLDGKIYEIRAQVRGNHYRATVVQDSDVHFIILSCFFKNQNKTPAKELKKAQQRYKEWLIGKQS
ncbi:Toxin HigB [Corynebacterium kalinowskii]|uniref:Toxin HigB n=1 Tax=Corynebacterium kalinowskii TaxID=2675216 RepID=A0A6B8V9D1_9CORY|nr:Toxin HigB [Corynebacterium kalinowskii]